MVGHWNIARKESGYTARALVEKLGISLIQGHVHRMGTHYKTLAKREIVGYEGGCLCNLNPTYLKRPNWQQGFILVYFLDGFFQCQPVPIVRTDEGVMFAIYGNKIYKRKIK